MIATGILIGTPSVIKASIENLPDLKPITCSPKNQGVSPLNSFGVIEMSLLSTRQAQFDVVISNIADYDCEDTFDTRCYLDYLPPLGELKGGNHRTYGLDAGTEDQWTITFTWPNDDDEHYIWVWADRWEVVDEADDDENNQQMYGPWTWDDIKPEV